MVSNKQIWISKKVFDVQLKKTRSELYNLKTLTPAHSVDIQKGKYYVLRTFLFKTG